MSIAFFRHATPNVIISPNPSSNLKPNFNPGPEQISVTKFYEKH